MTDDIIKYLFLALAFVGVFIRYRINRREFNRRNAMGIQGFSSYEKARFTVFIEGIGRSIGFLFIIIGLLMFLWLQYGASKKKIVHHPKHQSAVI
jgi:hypothetical protein